MIPLAILSLMIGLAVLMLPWRPWSTAESFDVDQPAAPDLSDITVLIPARNECDLIGRTLAGLGAQGSGMRIIVIDDHSTDGTACVAAASGLPGLEIVAAGPLADGWSGKLWALEQGRARATTTLIALLDADIALKPGVLAGLRERLGDRGLQLVSLMAHLRMETFCERMLLPAFVYYFKLIFPFALSNSPHSRVAAAAGGCVLLEARALGRIGGFAALKEALIDDCTLAARIKAGGGRIWIGLTHSALSQRGYSCGDIWSMVARSAYTQLDYSPGRLLACTALLTLYYLAAPALLMLGEGLVAPIAACAYLALALPYLPTLRYYGRSPLWAALLPATALLFLLMTLTSALRYHSGERSHWKGRSYARMAGSK